MIMACKSKSLATLCVCIVALFLGSCGRRDRASDNIVLPILSTRPPATYEISDLECQREQQPVVIEESSIWGWAEGFQVTNALTPLDHTLTNASLESRFVSGTNYGQLFSRTCPDRSCMKKEGTLIGYQPTAATKPLRICKSGFEYPRNSYEAVALTSLHYINKGALAYENNTGKTMSRVHLEVLPTFETIEPSVRGDDGQLYDVKYYITDNLAYLPLSTAIVVYPQSLYAASASLDRFWESAFVLMHELGHHIEEIRLGATLRKQGFYWSNEHHSYVTMAAGASDTANAVAKMWTAVSEAYADLLSFYADSESLRSLGQLNCIGSVRNPTVRLFADGKTRKIFDQKAYDEFLAGSRRSDNCDAIEFSDPHIVGAVLTNLQHESFVIATERLAADQKIKRRYNFVLEWRDAMSAAADLDPNEQNIFKHHKRASEKIFTSLTDAQKAKICALNVEILPFIPPPFEKHCEKSRFAFNQPWNAR